MTNSSIKRADADRPPGARSGWASDVRLGGALLVLAGAVLLLGIITAEATYPAAYSTGNNAISDLGGTEPPNSVVLQPSATVFDATMILAGLLVTFASAFVHRAFGLRSVTIPVVVLGVGATGVGVFPGYTGTPHAIFALMTFISGGVAALLSARVTRGPLRFVSAALGAIALGALASYVVLGDASPSAVLGPGGLERWIAYPILLWVTAFGGFVAGCEPGRERSRG